MSTNHQCSGMTQGGCRCRRRVPQEGGTCMWHTPLTGPDSTCSVCMEPMTTRNHRELPCGHKFHTKCIRKWKAEGNRTCPLCREEFDPPQFRITVNVEPVGPNANNFVAQSFDASDRSLGLLDMGIIPEGGAFTTELSFEAEDLDNLRNVLNRIGIELDNSDLDTLLRRDTE